MIPLVTIGMPTFNREWSLPQVLDSVLALDYDKSRVRICFVDNNSTDETVKLIEEFIKKNAASYEKIVFRTLSSNIPQARNLVFEEAAGTDYVFFLDSDIVAPHDALARMLASFEANPRVGIVALPWDARNSKKRAWFLWDAFRTPPGPHEAYKVGNGCNLVSMGAYKKVGGFNERLKVHEDSEFSFRMRRAGFKIVSDPDSQGTHLRDIPINPGYYFRFMRDSARTYRELMKSGSALHYAKVLSSLALIGSFLILLALPSWPVLLVFAGILAFAIWLNSSARLLDDGVRIRAAYRPLVGALYTAATLIITVFVIFDSSF